MIHITEDKLKAAIQICLGGDSIYTEQREAKLVHDIKALSIADVMDMLPTEMITRVEVIDEKGRSYVNWKPTNRIELQVQDNGRTLKVFVSQGNYP